MAASASLSLCLQVASLSVSDLRLLLLLRTPATGSRTHPDNSDDPISDLYLSSICNDPYSRGGPVRRPGGHTFWETIIHPAYLLGFSMFLLIKSNHTRPSRTRLCVGEYSCGILRIRHGLQGQEWTSMIFLVFHVLASGHQIFTRIAEQ